MAPNGSSLVVSGCVLAVVDDQGIVSCGSVRYTRTRYCTWKQVERCDDVGGRSAGKRVAELFHKEPHRYTLLLPASS